MTDAYAAGLIDGEGCIQISAKGYARMEMGMGVAALEVLEALAEEYGGSVRQTRPATKKWQAAHCWGIHNAQAAAMLRRVYPYLRLKQAQAAIALRVEELRQAHIPKGGQKARWTDAGRAEVMELRSRCMELNRKGPRTADARLAGRVWRTSSPSLLATTCGEPFSGTWPRSGSIAGGSAFEHRTWEPPTGATGCSSLLPTPHGFGKEGQARRPGPTGNELGRALTLLPTPMARSQSGTQVSGESRTGGPMLEEALKLLPTPRAVDGQHPRMQESRDGWGATLGQALKATESPSSGASTSPPSAAGKPSPAPRLNPSFVEWMMGTPLCGECGREWTDTDCPHSATAFRSRSAISSATT